MSGLSETAERGSKPNQLLRILAIVVVLALVALAWRVGPLRTWGDPARISAQLARFSGEPWAPVAMVGLFVLGGFVFFPILVLISATALVFDPWRALPIALLGALTSTSALYGAGALGLRRHMSEERLRPLAPIVRLLRGRDVVAVMVLRMLPVAPFTIVSVSLGLLSIPLRTALLGTALGMAPGLIAITAFGAQLRAVLNDPSPASVALLVALALGWLALAFGIQRLAYRIRPPKPGP
jgi:uncharacterized membrane protein YdjX (TVP38/TMEM64 family)